MKLKVEGILMNTKRNIVRYGVISTASIVPRFCRGMRLAGNGEVSVISSRDLKKAEQLAGQLDIPKSADDYHLILEDPDIDAVYIPLVNSLHYPYAKEALLAGKHVVMEKPFVLHSREAEELFALAEERSLFLTEAVKAPFLPVYRRIREIIEDHILGKLCYMDFRQSYNSGPYITGWNKEKDMGGGVMYGNEAYFFHMAEFLNGPIESCYGNASFFESGAEQQCSISVRFANNTMANLAVSNLVLFENGLTLYFEHGRIFIPDYWKASRAVIYPEDGEPETISCPCEYELQYELKHYNECILEGKLTSPVTPPEHTIRYIRYCEELRSTWENEKKP